MDSFQRKLQEVKRVIDDDSYRRRVLTLCQQNEPKSFEEYSSSGSFRKLEKFESSTYSEVLKAIDLADNNRPVVMKIMRALSKGVLKLLPSLSSKGCQSYNDILNELVVTQALSQLHEGVLLNGQTNALYKTHFFCLIHEIKVVSGSMEKTLSKSMQKEKEEQGININVNNDSVDAAATTNATETKTISNTSFTSQNTTAANRTSGGGGSGRGKHVSSLQQKLAGLSEAMGAIISSLELKQAPSFASAKRQFEKDQQEQQRQQRQDGNDMIDNSSSSNSGGGSRRRGPDNSDKLIVGKELNADSSNNAHKNTNQQEEIQHTNNNNYNDNEQNTNDSKQQSKISQSNSNDDELVEDEGMLIAALPHEYVVSVMRHDGQPLWWMMTHKRLAPEQLTSVLVQVIVGLAIAEHVYLYEHRDLHVSNILIKQTSNEMIPFIVDGRHYQIISHGIKATIIDATFSRLTHNGKVYFRDLTSTLRAYGARKTPPKMSLQNRSYRQMVRLTKNKWDEFTPKTNLIWLTYLCETLMKNEVMKSNATLTNEIKKIRDYTLKVKTTLDLLSCFPFEKAKSTSLSTKSSKSSSTLARASGSGGGGGGAGREGTMSVSKERKKP